MAINRTLLRIYRGLSYLLTYLCFELPRGLNISLRSKSRGITLPGSHGYALTSSRALKNMLSEIALCDKSFLDIGSGKGGVIIYAHQLGCAMSAGVEYEKHLHDISLRNIARLRLSAACTSYNVDARCFERYADFDIFFMFNPFDDDIYEEVINAITLQIMRSDISKPRYLICYGGANIEAVIKSGLFSLIREGECPYRGNLFRVFKSAGHG
jgi:16S rRNA G966 N2-methylase RsmD